MDIPSDLEEKSTDDENGFREKGGTIAYMMQRFRSSQPTNPEERRRQRDSGNIKDFWWQRNRRGRREVSSDSYQTSDADSQEYSSSSPIQDSALPRFPKPESYTAQLTARELDRLKKQHLEELRLDTESVSPYTESEGLLTESHDESISDPSPEEVKPDLERDARAAIAKARFHLSRVEEDENVGHQRKAVRFDRYIGSKQQKSSKNLNNMIDTLDLAMKSIRSRDPIDKPPTQAAAITSEVEPKLANTASRGTAAIPLASGMDAPAKLSEQGKQVEQLIAKAAEELVPDHSRYRWYAVNQPSDRDSVFDEDHAEDQQSLADTASTENMTPTKPSDINEELDIALLCLNNRLKGKKEEATPLDDAEQLASLKAQVIAKVDETVEPKVQQVQSAAKPCSQDLISSSLRTEHGYQPSESIARQLLQEDDKICLFQNFKLYEQQGTNLVNVASAVRVLTETMKVSGLVTTHVTHENVLALAGIPADEKASRHLTFDELTRVYDSFVERISGDEPREDYSSDDTVTESEQHHSKREPFEGVTARDIRGLQRCIEKVLDREERKPKVPETKPHSEQEPLQRSTGLYPGDIPEPVQPIRVPLAVHPFPIHQAPAIAIGAGPHFLNVPPAFNPEHRPSAPPFHPVNPNLITVDRNIMNSAVQAATIEYYKKLSEKYKSRKMCVEEGVQATLGAVQPKQQTMREQACVSPPAGLPPAAPVQWRYDAATKSLAVMNPKEHETSSVPKKAPVPRREEDDEKPSMFQTHRQLLTSAMDKLDHLKRLRLQLSES